MGRNTHSKRTKRSKRTRAKLVEPYMIKEAEKLHNELVQQLSLDVPVKTEAADEKKKKKKVIITSGEL